MDNGKIIHKDKLSASEALYGFCGWITSREEKVTASLSDDAGVWADLVADFCKRNNLAPPREGWHKNLESKIILPGG